MLNKKTASRILLSCLLFLCTSGSFFAAEKESSAQTILNVRDFSDKESFTGGIQEAIDALPESGGTVIVPVGTFMLRRSIQPRSGVTIRGQGNATVLVRPREFRTGVTEKISAKENTAVLRETGLLQKGDQVFIKDRKNVGWNARNGIITAIKDNVLTLRIEHSREDRVFSPSNGAYCANWFPAFWLWNVDNVRIENLAIDGKIEKHPAHRSDFVVAAIHSRGGRDLFVSMVAVRNWPGDGISLQKTRGAMVRGCIIENCRGNGLHPGSGASNTIWTENMVRNNTRRGFFFCMNVTHSVCKDSIFLNNGESGIGGLGRGDRYNVVSGNICTGNGYNGIEAIFSICNIIQSNICRNNCRRRNGPAIYLKGHRDTIVRGNLCADDQETPTQTDGVVSHAPAGTNIIENNHTTE